MQTVILSVLALILAGGIYWIASGSPEVPAPTTAKDDVMMDADSSTEKDAMINDAMKKEPADAMKENDERVMEKEMGAMMRKGSIEAYSPDKLALAQSGKVVIFFHATWCPICRALDAEAVANPSLVPDGVTVLKVDYDTATALKQKYGVTVQHTFVQVDASGASLAKWSDATTYAQLFARLK
jgi:thiol-disulfide isomerase/thioredoxin